MRDGRKRMRKEPAHGIHQSSAFGINCESARKFELPRNFRFASLFPTSRSVLRSEAKLRFASQNAKQCEASRTPTHHPWRQQDYISVGCLKIEVFFHLSDLWLTSLALRSFSHLVDPRPVLLYGLSNSQYSDTSCHSLQFYGAFCVISDILPFCEIVISLKSFSIQVISRTLVFFLNTYPSSVCWLNYKINWCRTFYLFFIKNN